MLIIDDKYWSVVNTNIPGVREVFIPISIHAT